MNPCTSKYTRVKKVCSDFNQCFVKCPILWKWTQTDENDKRICHSEIVHCFVWLDQFRCAGQMEITALCM